MGFVGEDDNVNLVMMLIMVVVANVDPPSPYPPIKSIFLQYFRIFEGPLQIAPLSICR